MASKSKTIIHFKNGEVFKIPAFSKLSGVLDGSSREASISWTENGSDYEITFNPKNVLYTITVVQST